MALSSLIVNAYRQMGHGACIKLSYTSRLFNLCTVMYVDDTDLFHWLESPVMDPETLIHHVQTLTTDYSHLAQASGGILKKMKCSIYFLAYKYVHGRARLMSLCNLPTATTHITEGNEVYPSHIRIPQPEGPDALIVTHEATTASKMLGVHFSPARNFSTHVDHMVQKGLDWVDCLRTKPISRADAWLSFYLQMFPGMSWGLVTVCMSPSKLDAKIHKVYEKAFPFLGVNCKIKRQWRTLPEMYQELGVPNFPLIALSSKISFLLGNGGLHGQTHSDCMTMAFKNFLVEVGLYGSPFDWSYEDFGHLATESTWFCDL
jgi:hypothetical protein